MSWLSVNTKSITDFSARPNEFHIALDNYETDNVGGLRRGQSVRLSNLVRHNIYIFEWEKSMSESAIRKISLQLVLSNFIGITQDYSRGIARDYSCASLFVMLWFCPIVNRFFSIFFLLYKRACVEQSAVQFNS